MKRHHSLSFISQACRSKAGFLKAGVTACAITLAIGLPLHPQKADAAKPQAPTLPVEEAPKKLRKDRSLLGETPVELTDAGKALANQYAARLAALQAEITHQLPTVSDAQKQAVRDALAAQKISEVKYDLATRGFRNGYSGKVTGLQSAIEKLEEAPAKLANAEMYLKNALAMPDGHEAKERAVEEAQKEVENRKKNLEKLPVDVEKARKALEEAKAKLPENKKKLEAAAQELQASKANTAQALVSVGIHTILDSDKLDAKLAQATVLTEATPYWLAVYAQQGSEQEQRVEKLLANTPLLIDMLIADGAMWGKYPQAVEIYEAIGLIYPESHGLKVTPS